MLHGKGIKNIWELKNDFTHSWVEPDFVNQSLKLFSFSQLSKSVSEIKKRGYNFEWLLTILLSTPFIGSKTVNSMLNGHVKHQVEIGKDTFYRLKNHSQINWRLLQWLFAFQFQKIVTTKLTTTGKEHKCLIFDDTMLRKTGKKIEKVSRVFDHVSKHYLLGFKLLLMGYWDGYSFIPIDFSLHRERGSNKQKPYGLKKKEMRKQFHKKREKGTCAYERASEADQSKIKCVIKMFKRAISMGYIVDYVLVDSWFTCEALIDAVLKTTKSSTNLIGMYKIPRTKFLYRDKELTHSQIRNMLGKAKRCRKLKLYYLETEVEYKGRTIKLAFSKKGVNGKWKVFICTDTQLSFIKMIEIYQIRWTIEVFFKESKQLLGLGRCQSNDFDAQIAEATITMLQYILMTMRFRIEHYESMNGLFSELSEQVIQKRLDQRLWGLFIEILNIIEILFDDIDENELMSKIFENDEARNKIAKLLNNPEKLNCAA